MSKGWLPATTLASRVQSTSQLERLNLSLTIWLNVIYMYIYQIFLDHSTLEKQHSQAQANVVKEIPPKPWRFDNSPMLSVAELCKHFFSHYSNWTDYKHILYTHVVYACSTQINHIKTPPRLCDFSVIS